MRTRIAFISAMLLLLFASPAARGADPAYASLVPGSDPARAVKCGEASVYVYPEYIVYASKSPAFEGQDIRVFMPRSPVDDPCSLASRQAYYAINAGEFGGANTFIGMRGGYLFIDEWPGREDKRFLVIDAASKSLVYFDWYADPAIENGKLEYNRVIKASGATKKEIPCPDAEKWEKEGRAVLYVEKMSLDLTTMKGTDSGKFSCESAAPITKRAADYTIH